MRKIILATLAATALTAAVPFTASAEPGGCLKYGAAGAVGGHLMHHGVLGAVGGCAAGMWRRHEYRKEVAHEHRYYREHHPEQHHYW